MSIATERSADHRWAERELDVTVLSYDSEHRFGKYSVDIYLPEWHLGVEIDGPRHSARKDGDRDEELRERYGVELLHIDTVRHKSDSGKPTWRASFRNAVFDFINQHAGTTQARMATWRKNSATG